MCEKLDMAAFHNQTRRTSVGQMTGLSRSIDLILGPRPGKKSLARLQERGVTHIVTLLSDREGGGDVARLASKIGAQWRHCPVEGGHLDILSNVDLTAVFAVFAQIGAEHAKPVIYLHCSAGIHRTGFIAYALFRHYGATEREARDHLAAIRAVTAEQLGEDRMALAERMLAAFGD